MVEGNSHLAGVIKYLTHSTWSHAALFVGPITSKTTADGEFHVLVESNIGEGVVSTALSRYARFHTRICRPIGLDPEDLEKVCAYVISSMGLNYDLRNFVDLGRYLVPLPVPQRWRRRMVALGSGSPNQIHLLCVDCKRVPVGTLSDPAQDHRTGEKSRPARNPSDPAVDFLHAARFRHLPVFCRHQADN